MGLLIDGKWHDQWYDTGKSGKFERKESQFRDWITADGKPAPGKLRGFKAEPGRYHLYVSLACPWAHRTLILRKLKKLEDVISVSVVHHFMGENGWTFETDDAATGDTLYGSDFLHQIYTKADPDYSDRVTRPLTNSATNRSISIPKACAKRSIASTPSSIRRSTTASTARASPPLRKPMRKRSTNSSPRSTRSRPCLANGAIWRAMC